MTSADPPAGCTGDARADLPVPQPITAAGLAALDRAHSKADRITAVARLIHDTFLSYHRRDLAIPGLAKQAFEACDWRHSVALSGERIRIYGQCIDAMVPVLRRLCPEAEDRDSFWEAVEAAYRPHIHGRYHADLAFAFLNSVRRRTAGDDWRAIPYSFAADSDGGDSDGDDSDGDDSDGGPVPAGAAAARPRPTVVRRLPVDAKIDTATVRRILDIPGFTAPYADPDGDAERVRTRIAEILSADGGAPRAVAAVEMIDAGFYRNRGAYLVGRIRFRTGPCRPLALALLHDRGGIVVDAVLCHRHDLFHVFSTTRANFHVTNPHYHELVDFLCALMPQRPHGMHYSTIGYNHVGKQAVMHQMALEMTRAGEANRQAATNQAATNQAADNQIADEQGMGDRLGTAPGFEGTVAIGFSAPSLSYVLKVIRDRPTSAYKWGRFPGIDAVLAKYRLVHEINRTGSMLDNVIYNHLSLPAAWFDAALLDTLLCCAGANVSRRGDRLVFRHLIVQRKLVPVTEFMKTAAPDAAARVMANLGRCIKNNAAANIFNKDLDARNYGVGESHKVYLFDYDALEPLAAVKIRSNHDREDGDEEVPDWFFEDGHVFLPEELEVGLCLDNRQFRALLRRAHGDLMSPAYWLDVQQQLAAGKVPRIGTYLEERRLARHGGRPEPVQDYWGA